MNKSRPRLINNNTYDRDINDDNFKGDFLDYNKTNKKNNTVQAQPKTEQKVEMSYLSKKNEDSDSD